jgi:hypothetical protein
MFASAIDPCAATVRLLLPVPMGIDLEEQESTDGIAIIGPQGPVATVRPLRNGLEVEPLPWMSDEALRLAEQHWIDHRIPRHGFPTCFGCGHARAERDGLALFAGDVPNSDLCAASWTPAESLTSTDGGIPDWIIWAALDCPSGAVTLRHLPEGAGIVLGELTVHIAARPHAGERYEVVARDGGTDGRRLYAEVGLVNASGENLAVGRATWFELRPG